MPCYLSIYFFTNPDNLLKHVETCLMTTILWQPASSCSLVISEMFHLLALLQFNLRPFRKYETFSWHLQGAVPVLCMLHPPTNTQMLSSNHHGQAFLGGVARLISHCSMTSLKQQDEHEKAQQELQPLPMNKQICW